MILEKKRGGLTWFRRCEGMCAFSSRSNDFCRPVKNTPCSRAPIVGPGK